MSDTSPTDFPSEPVGRVVDRAPRHTVWPLVALLAGLAPQASSAQASLHDDAMGNVAMAQEANVGFTRGSFILAPIPIQNPTIGGGLALGAGYLFTIDPGSSASFVGVGGFRTDNGSNGFALGTNLEFGDGRWDLRVVVGEADLIYDLFVKDVSFPIEQTGLLGRVAISYGLTDTFSAGLELGYIESELAPGGDALPESIALDFGIASATADLLLEYDTRDDTIYPTSGVDASLRFGQGTLVEGPDRDFTRALAKVPFYVPVFGDGVVAAQLAACNVSDETPFFLACSLGASDAFRGYPSTQYIDHSLMSLQAAYRGRLGARFGYAMFAGVGRIANNFGDLRDADNLAAAGLGLRLRVSKKFPVDFSVDVAVNLEDETTTYIYVGQRF